jgi:hypothetical protein
MKKAQKASEKSIKLRGVYMLYSVKILVAKQEPHPWDSMEGVEVHEVNLPQLDPINVEWVCTLCQCERKRGVAR